MKVDILAVGAHPDDIELSCAGTLIKHIEAGYTAGILDLTLGELGTRGSKEIRSKEAAASAKIIGVSFRENLNFRDGFFENSEENKLSVVRILRKYRPDIILANAISDRHPDHGRAAAIIKDAVFLSGLKRVETSLDGKDQELWRPRVIYNYIQDRYRKPDFIVDITGYMEKRKEAIKAFGSQFYNPDSSEPETAISTKQFFDSLTARALEWGRMIGVEYGEGFEVERIPGIDNLFHLK